MAHRPAPHLQSNDPLPSAVRVISKDEGMKLVVNALLASIPSMSNVVVVCSLVMLIFAIMGVSIFKGAFYRCEDPPTSLSPIDMNTIITK